MPLYLNKDNHSIYILNAIKLGTEQIRQVGFFRSVFTGLLVQLSRSTVLSLFE